LRYFRN